MQVILEWPEFAEQHADRRSPDRCDLQRLKPCGRIS
jgi:hypothetical protein